MRAPCKLDGCDRPTKGRGMCCVHYRAYRHTINPECEVPGCQRKQDARGLCNTHYTRWQRGPRTVTATGLGAARVNLRHLELLEEFRFLTDQGETFEAVAQKLGIQVPSLVRSLRRNGIVLVYVKLNGANRPGTYKETP